MVNIWLMMINNNLVGGWPTPLKNISSSVGMMTFPIYIYGKHEKNVPNHQPENVCGSFSESHWLHHDLLSNTCGYLCSSNLVVCLNYVPSLLGPHSHIPLLIFACFIFRLRKYISLNNLKENTKKKSQLDLLMSLFTLAYNSDFWWLPSGKRLRSYGKIHHAINGKIIIFLWHFSIAILVYQAGYFYFTGYLHDISIWYPFGIPYGFSVRYISDEKTSKFYPRYYYIYPLYFWWLSTMISIWSHISVGSKFSDLMGSTRSLIDKSRSPNSEECMSWQENSPTTD